MLSLGIPRTCLPPAASCYDFIVFLFPCPAEFRAESRCRLLSTLTECAVQSLTFYFFVPQRLRGIFVDIWSFSGIPRYASSCSVLFRMLILSVKMFTKFEKLPVENLVNCFSTDLGTDFFNSKRTQQMYIFVSNCRGHRIEKYWIFCGNHFSGGRVLDKCHWKMGIAIMPGVEY